MLWCSLGVEVWEAGAGGASSCLHCSQCSSLDVPVLDSPIGDSFLEWIRDSFHPNHSSLNIRRDPARRKEAACLAWVCRSSVLFFKDKAGAFLELLDCKFLGLFGTGVTIRGGSLEDFAPKPGPRSSTSCR
jgi:hypothetical protein